MTACNNFSTLNCQIVNCRLCERLVQFRETLPARAAYKGSTYWRKPVTGFGDPNGWLVFIGLAPSAHGGNRTGRIFTGDESARFLFNALYLTGFANQASSISIEDGLILSGCYLTAAVKCVPPKNLPTLVEINNCSRYLHSELTLLKNASSIVALGGLAFKSILSYAKMHGQTSHGSSFKHGASYRFSGLPTVYCSYHPSPQNTYTGKLTQQMLIDLLERIKENRQS